MVCFSVFARCGVAEGFSRLGSVGRRACVAVFLGRFRGGVLWGIRWVLKSVKFQEFSHRF